MKKPFVIALVLLSGGQDSTTCLGWAKEQQNLGKYDLVAAVSIDYGQRHAVELESAAKIAQIFDVEHKVIKIPDGTLAGSSPLTNKSNQVEQYESAEVLPGGVEKTFVPMRNALFLVLLANQAANFMEKYPDARYVLVTGVCEEDYGGYPDCRRVFIDSMETALSLATQGQLGPFSIATPLMFLNKKKTVQLAAELDEGLPMWEALAQSHTCYNGQVPPCGKCHACLLRERGFKEAGYDDPLLERLNNG